MANYSEQQNTTSFLALLCLSECIVMLTVFSIVAKVTLNTLKIITYLKEQSLPKRSMYLVINQTVVDMFVGGNVIIQCWFLGSNCDF